MSKEELRRKLYYVTCDNKNKENEELLDELSDEC